jgi:hypothetical protein
VEAAIASPQPPQKKPVNKYQEIRDRILKRVRSDKLKALKVILEKTIGHFHLVIIKIFVDRFGDLGWSGERPAQLDEYNKALAIAKHRNPKYPRDVFLPLDLNEVVELEEGLFKVGENLELRSPFPQN